MNDDFEDIDREEEFKTRDIVTGKKGTNPLNKKTLDYGELDEIMLGDD